MKKIIITIGFIFSLLLFSGCVDGNKSKLKKEIAVANVDCPVNMGIIGDLLSIKYQEKENRIIMYYSINEEIGGGLFLQKNKEKLHQQLRLSFSKSESQEMLKDIINAKASVLMIYKAPSSGKIIKFDLPYEELKELQINPMSDYDIQRIMIENKIDVENARCPYKSDEGMTTTKVALVDNFIVYYYEMDESLYNMDDIRRQAPYLKEADESNLKSMQNDLYIQNELKLLINQNIGYKYRYYGNKSKKYVDIDFTSDELSNFLQ